MSELHFTIDKPVVSSILAVVVVTRGVAPLVTIGLAVVVATVYGIVVNMSTVVSSADIAVVSPVSEVVVSTVTTVSTAEITRRKITTDGQVGCSPPLLILSGNYRYDLLKHERYCEHFLEMMLLYSLILCVYTLTCIH